MTEVRDRDYSNRDKEASTQVPLKTLAAFLLYLKFHLLGYKLTC